MRKKPENFRIGSGIVTEVKPNSANLDPENEKLFRNIKSDPHCS